jgi:hypothetical protein
VKVYPLTFAALALAGGLVGCSGPVKLVRESKPHATLVVDVAHAESSESGYNDVLILDGAEYAVGRGEGGQLSVLLAPGKHELRIVSARQEPEHQVVDVLTQRADCSIPGCPVTPTYETSIRLGTRDASVCERTVEADFRQGQTVHVKFMSNADGTCVAEGV